MDGFEFESGSSSTMYHGTSSFGRGTNDHSTSPSVMITNQTVSDLHGTDSNAKITALSNLRTAVKSQSGQLPIANLKRLFDGIRSCLVDPSLSVRHETLKFVCDMAPYVEAEFNNYTQPLLSTLVGSLGDSDLSIQNTATEALALLVTHSFSSNNILRAMVEKGFRNDDATVRERSIHALPSIVGQSSFGVKWKYLLEHLIERLRDVHDRVVSTAEFSVVFVAASNPQGVHLVDELDTMRRNYLESHMPQLESEVSRFTHQRDTTTHTAVTSSSSSSSSPSYAPTSHSHSHGTSSSTNNTHTSSSPTMFSTSTRGGSASPAAVHTSSPPYGYSPRDIMNGGGAVESDESDISGHSITESSRALEFGFVPYDVVAQLEQNQDSDYLSRMSAIEEIHSLLAEVTDLQYLVSHVGSLVRFLSSLMEDSNFKILLTTLQILGDLVKKVPQQIQPHLEYLIPRLILKFAENKLVIRHANMKLFSVILSTFRPEPVMAILLDHMNNSNAHVREQVTNVISYALLTAKSASWDYTLLASTLLKAVNDSSSQVQRVALEAFAVLYNIMGQDLRRHLETVCSDPMVMGKLQERFFHPPPSVNEDGLIVPSSFYHRRRSTMNKNQAEEESHNKLPPNRRQPSAGLSKSTNKIPFSLSRSSSLNSNTSLSSSVGGGGGGNGDGDSSIEDLRMPPSSHGNRPPSLIGVQRQGMTEPHSASIPRDTPSHTRNRRDVGSAPRVRPQLMHGGSNHSLMQSRPDSGDLNPSPRSRSHTAQHGRRAVRDGSMDYSSPASPLPSSPYPNSTSNSTNSPRPGHSRTPSRSGSARRRSNLSVNTYGSPTPTVSHVQPNSPFTPSSPNIFSRDTTLSPVYRHQRQISGEEDRYAGLRQHPIVPNTADLMRNTSARSPSSPSQGFFQSMNSPASSQLPPPSPSSYARSPQHMPANTRNGPVRAFSHGGPPACGGGAEQQHPRGRDPYSVSAPLPTMHHDDDISHSVRGEQISYSDDEWGSDREEEEAEVEEQEEEEEQEESHRTIPEDDDFSLPPPSSSSSSSRNRYNEAEDRPLSSKSVVSEKVKMWLGDDTSTDMGSRSDKYNTPTQEDESNRFSIADSPEDISAIRDASGSQSSTGAQTERIHKKKVNSKLKLLKARSAQSATRTRSVIPISASPKPSSPPSGRRAKTVAHNPTSPYPSSGAEDRDETPLPGAGSSGYNYDFDDEMDPFGTRSPLPRGEDTPVGGNRSGSSVSRRLSNLRVNTISGDAVCSPTSAKSVPASRPRSLVSSPQAHPRSPQSDVPTKPRVKTTPHKSRAMPSGGSKRPVGSRSARPSRLKTASSRRQQVDREPSTPSTPSYMDKVEASYTLTEDLPELAHPEDSLRRVARDIKSSEWSKRFDTLNEIRSLIVHHTDIILPEIRPLCGPIKKEVDSLRSSLAKNGLMCLEDCFSNLGREMDSLLEKVVPSLIKRAGEKNFLGEAASETLTAMLENCGVSRCLSALLNVSSHKSITIRTCAARWLSNAVQTIGPKIQNSKEYPRLVQRIAEFLGEGSIDIRTDAKRGVVLMAQYSSLIEFEHFSKRTLTSQQFSSVKKVLDKGLNQTFNPTGVIRTGSTASNASCSTPVKRGVSSAKRQGSVRSRKGSSKSRARSPPSSSSGSPGLNRDSSESFLMRGRSSGLDIQQDSIETTTSSSLTPKPLRKKHSRKASNMNAAIMREGERLQPITTGLMSSDWQTRLSSLNDLDVFVGSSPEASKSHVIKIFDALNERLSDGNTKVCMQALNTLDQVMPVLEESLSKVINTLVPKLAGNMANSNASIRSRSRQCMESLSKQLDSYQLLESFASAITYGNSRVKPLMLDLFVDLVEPAFDLKPQVVTKYVLPVAFGLMSERKADVREANRRLVQTLYILMGDELFDAHANVCKKGEVQRQLQTIALAL